MNLINEFKKEINQNDTCPGIDMFRCHYIGWLENKFNESKKSSKNETIEKIQTLLKDAYMAGYEQGNQDTLNNCYNDSEEVSWDYLDSLKTL